MTREITVSHVRYRDRGACPSHTHGRAFIAMVLCGGYTERFRTFSISLQATQLSFHPEGTEHADEVSTPGTSFLIVEAARSFVDPSPGGCCEPRVLGPEAAGRGAELIEALRVGDGNTPLVLESLAAELYDAARPTRLERNGQKPRWVNQVIELLTEDYAEPLSLHDLGRAVALHPVYVSRAFRHFTGRGIVRTLRTMRVERAISQLAAGAPIAEVALATGFADQSHLTKAVRRVTGRTPGQWRGLRRTPSIRNSSEGL